MFFSSWGSLNRTFSAFVNKSQGTSVLYLCHYCNLMRQIRCMKSVMRHFDLSSIPLFLNVTATSVDGGKNFALLRKIHNLIFIMKNN